MEPTARAERWQQTLHELLPISAAMAVTVGELPDGRLAIRAALAPNSNDKGTGFGGSIAALGIMAGWCAVTEAVHVRHPGTDVVIQRAETDYVAPARADFHACAAAFEPGVLERFLQTLARRGRARIVATVDVISADTRVAVVTGTYVARRGS
jgi:thioesterase domain-containing protein